MAVFKCKMCGGNLEVQEGMTVCECEYCGSTQTVPSLDDEKKITLFTRANRLRSACEFDKAAGVYESIVAEFQEEAEAYWGLILCKYGIEYVDDPKTGKKIPTCHRSSFDSVMDDENFDMVMEYSDPISRAVYREEAKTIEKLRNDIIEVSSMEEPYDIFICYKETDLVGERTIDSVIAQDVYDVLVDKGYRVFFSRITLEDKLGQEYEPYIFAALNSAKVMLAFGTDYEYYNAVWVKNEWSRFLSLIEKGEKKTLIPCYKGIDAYDMPKEFARLQAQDMGKVGAIQDLVRGIEKIIGVEKKELPQENKIVSASANAYIEPLLKRAFMFLEDGEWASANEYCEKVLDIDPEIGEAYLGKLMSELKVEKKEKLSKCEEPFDGYNNYQKAVRFADEKLKKELEKYNTVVNQRIEDKRKAKEAKIKNRKDCIEEAKKKYEEALEFHQKKQENYAKEKEVVNQKREQEAQRVFVNLEKEYEHKKVDIQKNIGKIEEEMIGYQIELSELGIFKISRKKELSKLLTKKKEEKRILEESMVEAKKKLTQEKERFKKEIEKELPYPKEPTQQDEILQLRYSEYLKVALSLTQKGDSIFFGKYRQKDKSERKEDIEWLVLDKWKKEVLLISKYGLDCKKFHNSETAVTWEDSSIRAWLNNEFMNNAFKSKEKEMISTATIKADKNPIYHTDSGKDTLDQVFLLSIKQANTYFKSKNERECKPTAYAVENMDNNTGNCEWWLRSSGENNNKAAVVNIFGNVLNDGDRVSLDGIAVRPAMWINLD